MPIDTLHRNFTASRARSIARSTVVMIAIGAIGYLAGALVHDKLPAPNDSVASARSIQPSETNSEAVFAAVASPATVPDAYGLLRLDAERIDDPRECDILNGISTACVFMD